jgi:hypothetical protein
MKPGETIAFRGKQLIRRSGQQNKNAQSTGKLARRCWLQ